MNYCISNQRVPRIQIIMRYLLWQDPEMRGTLYLHALMLIGLAGIVQAQVFKHEDMIHCKCGDTSDLRIESSNCCVKLKRDREFATMTSDREACETTMGDKKNNDVKFKECCKKTSTPTCKPAIHKFITCTCTDPEFTKKCCEKPGYFQKTLTADMKCEIRSGEEYRGNFNFCCYSDDNKGSKPGPGCLRHD